MKRFKVPVFKNSWRETVQLPLVKPKLIDEYDDSTSVEFTIVNGYQIVNPYYKEMSVRPTHNKHKLPMDFLKIEFNLPLDERQKRLGLPREKDGNYWTQLQKMDLIWVKGERKYKHLSEDIKRQISGKPRKTYNISAVGTDLDKWNLRLKDEIISLNCIHELPVPINTSNGIDIPIIYQDSNILVVDKPYGVPVHPTGNSYRYNSVINILKSKHEWNFDLWPCHRLDKDTTGILILAKSKTACGEMSELIGDKGIMEKIYCVKVHGEFPKNKVSNDFVVPLDLTNHFKSGGIRRLLEHATTEFRLMSFDPESNTNLIEAKLKTGKRHQIRQHLRNIGFPIVNDPLYGKNAILSEPMFHFPKSNEFEQFKLEYAEQHQKKMDDSTIFSVCEDCAHVTYVPNKFNSPMNLHAFSYRSENGKYQFQTGRPKWWKFTAD